MASSDITVAGLVAEPTLRGNKLKWTYSDPRLNALPNIGLDMVEVHASTTNDRATATKVGEGITDFTHAGLVEEQTWYYWIKARDYLGAFGSWYPSGSTSGVSAKARGISGLAFGLANGQIVATVAASALTVALKTLAGNDPSASDPIYAAFRSDALAGGGYTVATLTSALSLTVSSGSTLQAIAAQPLKTWVVLLYDSGSFRLGIINCYDGSIKIWSLIDGDRVTAVAEGGAGLADFAGVFYTTVGATTRYRIIGSLEWSSGLATPGTWNVAPDIINLYSIGSNTPGTTVQEYLDLFSTQATTTALIPFDNTIPQISEGSQARLISWAAQSATNLLEFEAVLNLSHTVASPVIVALFRGSGPDAIAVAWGSVPVANNLTQVILRHRMVAGDITSHSFTLRYGAVNAGTLSLNWSNGTSYFNNTLLSSFRIRELLQ